MKPPVAVRDLYQQAVAVDFLLQFSTWQKQTAESEEQERHHLNLFTPATDITTSKASLVEEVGSTLWPCRGDMPRGLPVHARHLGDILQVQ